MPVLCTLEPTVTVQFRERGEAYHSVRQWERDHGRYVFALFVPTPFDAHTRRLVTMPKDNEQYPALNLAWRMERGQTYFLLAVTEYENAVALRGLDEIELERICKRICKGGNVGNQLSLLVGNVAIPAPIEELKEDVKTLQAAFDQQKVRNKRASLSNTALTFAIIKVELQQQEETIQRQEETIANLRRHVSDLEQKMRHAEDAAKCTDALGSIHLGNAIAKFFELEGLPDAYKSAFDKEALATASSILLVPHLSTEFQWLRAWLSRFDWITEDIIMDLRRILRRCNVTAHGLRRDLCMESIAMDYEAGTMKGVLETVLAKVFEEAD
ncbi:hypothetical protein HK104_003984 [Borealophlyctis nickersoniae]|nr:hypothetical protein HK104_003984 [Borealophlyctis nickersoniae]